MHSELSWLSHLSGFVSVVYHYQIKLSSRQKYEKFVANAADGDKVY